MQSKAALSLLSEFLLDSFLISQNAHLEALHGTSSSLEVARNLAINCGGNSDFDSSFSEAFPHDHLNMSLVCRSCVVGDTSNWQVSCSAMEAVKSAAKARNAKVVVVVVGTGSELPEERAGAISRLAAIDKKCDTVSYLQHQMECMPDDSNCIMSPKDHTITVFNPKSFHFVQGVLSVCPR